MVANFIVPDHDADAFKPLNATQFGFYTDKIIGGFTKWDSQHFLFVAKHGYVLEQSLAFFPLLPLLSRLISGCILILLAPLFTQEALLLIAMLTLNCYCFVQSAILHYRFARDLLKSHHLSLLIASLFCINPASIFMSAAYTESLYHMLTMFGLVHLRNNKPFLAAISFSLSAACRSNGMMNVIYLVLYVIHANYTKLSEALEPKKRVSLMKKVFSSLWIIADSLSIFSLLTILCVVPYFLFQYFAYSVHCSRTFEIQPSPYVVDFARKHGLRLLTDEPASEWCNLTLPFSYPFLQQHYWGVGFLSYFEIKQIPNFLLATPVVILTTMCLRTEFRELFMRFKAAWDNQSLSLLAMPYTSVLTFTLAGHLAFMFLFGFFVTNVQIITRLLFSSSPLLYWYTAKIIYTDAVTIPELQTFFVEQESEKKAEYGYYLSNNPLILIFAHWHLLSLRSRLILCYFLTYFIVGTALFCNFFPWT